MLNPPSPTYRALLVERREPCSADFAGPGKTDEHQWQRYIDPAWLDVAPVGLSEVRRDMRVRVKDQVLSISPGRRTPSRGWTGGVGWRAAQDTSYLHAEEREWNPQSQLDAMHAEGLDAEVLIPSRGLFVLGLDTVEHAVGAPGYETGLAAAVARAYNDWFHDFCQADPTRLFGAGLLAPPTTSVPPPTR